MTITDLTPSALCRAAQIKEQIDAFTSELSSILGGVVSLNPQPLPPKTGRGRNMSAAGRARIAAAARARWARIRAGKGASPTSKPKGARRMSPAARAKIAAAAKARWAKAKAAGKSRL